MTQAPDRITLPAAQQATHSIIWLHGLGADGNDFVPIIPLLELRPTTRVILPHAPVRPITANNGMTMRGWYDIKNFDFNPADEDLAGIRASAAAIAALAAEETAQGIPAAHILYAGFSQGGVIALYHGLRTPCGGILALSTYLADSADTPAADCDHCPPILQMHGTQDPIVPYRLGKLAHEQLKNKGYAPAWRDYPMQHQVCPPQIADIAQWLHEQGC